MDRAATRGALFGLGSAALFGLGAPLAKLLVPRLPVLLFAGLLYLGAGLGLSMFAALRRSGREAGLGRRDLPLLFGVVTSGGIVGPVLLLLGLARISAVEGALLLNLEGVFTILLALLVFREHLGRDALLASASIVAGAALLSVPSGDLAFEWRGSLAIAGASLAWGIDNNLTQRLSVRDPVAIARVKTLVAGSCNLGLALLFGERLPPLVVVGAALLLGLVSYGASIVLDVYALRILGAAREAAYFATAPFIGALAAIVLVGDRLRAPDLGAGALMAIGVILLLRERHGHAHTHSPLEHDHLHEHDEHHQHAHEHADADGANRPHAHLHRHEPLTHDHPHVSDSHHRHKH